MHRIGLGTVQFGSRYGVTNKLGKPSRKECEKIIETAIDAGIKYYDTAAYYGDADLILASCLPPGMKVVTKINTPSEANQSIDIFGENLYAILSDKWAAEWPIKSGISVYWPNKIDPESQIVQMPLNLADTRNLKLAQIYHDRGVEVHARSIFLQGLLLEKGATIRQCLKFVLDQPVDVALVGVNSSDEIKQIIEAVETIDQETVIPNIQINHLDPREWGPHANH
jgi:aryl-alcohol dehydrogenase-like predicted oxidoreductase